VRHTTRMPRALLSTISAAASVNWRLATPTPEESQRRRISSALLPGSAFGSVIEPSTLVPVATALCWRVMPLQIQVPSLQSSTNFVRIANRTSSAVDEIPSLRIADAR
jgi:hypothetical protein